MKKICLLVILLCGLMISSMSTVSAAADWVWVYSNKGCACYVDNNSIGRDTKYSGYVFHAFVKGVLNDAGREEFIKGMRSQGITGIQNVSFFVYLQYFKNDNGVKYQATSKGYIYDRNGNLIKEISNKNLEWQTIAPSTYNETLFDNIRARVPN